MAPLVFWRVMARLRLVPWEPTWLDHTSLDLHAIYRRPRRNRQTWQIERDEYGFIAWDLTSGLPIRQHAKFVQKGFQYVTLATAEDVIQASDPSILDRGAVPLGGTNRPADESADVYLRQPGVRGPWDATAYLADLEDTRQERVLRIVANIEKYGPDGAEAFERQTDQGYQLPPRFRQPPQPVASTESAEPAKRRRGRPRKVQPAPEPAAV